MSRIATMGTSSCAAIAIAGFKQQDIDLNEAYIASPDTVKRGEGHSVQDFYDKVLYPTSQPLGHTAQYPFELLMEELGESDMVGKFTIITLNKYQTLMKDGYWLKQLSKWGFKQIDITNNIIGEHCYIFTRNINRVE